MLKMRLNGMHFSFSTGVLCFSPLCVFNIFIYYICVEYVCSMGCISVSELECFAQSLRTLLKVWAYTKGGEECINIHTELCCPYGSDSPGREFWPKCGPFLKKVEPLSVKGGSGPGKRSQNRGDSLSKR